MSDKYKGKKLFYAIYENITEKALELIKDKSTDVNWSNPNGFTPLIRACEQSKLPVIKFLIAREDILPSKTNNKKPHCIALGMFMRIR